MATESVQRVRKCPKCGGAFLLWTGVCLRCGRVGDPTSWEKKGPAPGVMDVRVVQVVEEGGQKQKTGFEPLPGKAPPPGVIPESGEPLPVDEMFDTGEKQTQKFDPAAVKAAAEGSLLAEKPPIPANARHYLVFGYKDAIELVPGKKLSIGRHQSQSLRIDRPEVSRRHAEIDWQGDPFLPFIRDAGPLNTYLNGKPVPVDHPGISLNDGDEIWLGRNFKMAYRHTAMLSFNEQGRNVKPASETRGTSARVPRVEEPPPPTEAESDHTPGPSSMGKASEGDFAKTEPTKLLEQLLADKSSGVLRIFAGAGSGTILFENGKAKTIIFGSLTGRDALEKIALLEEGTYRFLETGGGNAQPTS